jgi:formiminotetrahydrofolate cyclodeaminase
MKSKTLKFFQNIDVLTPKRVISILVIAVVIAIIIFVIIYFSKSKIEKNKLEDEIKQNIEENRELQNYTQAEYSVMADDMEKAFSYFWGTDLELVYSTFQKLQNTTDLLELKKAYGYRNAASLFGMGAKNLDESIEAELNKSEITKVNNILVQKNIDYQFSIK